MLNSVFQVKKSGKFEKLSQEERKNQEVRFHSLPDFFILSFFDLARIK